MDLESLSVFTDHAVTGLIRVALALAIFFAGRMMARWICGILSTQLKKHGLDDMLVKLASKTAYFSLIALIILAALEQIGINTTSALAVFGAAGLAVGLAVKDSLSNFASGVMIAFFRPFRLGHYIEAAGTSGSVQEVGMFNTTLLTPDNRRVVVPNRLIYNDTIVNYSAEETRRVDMVFGISYEDDMGQARALIEELIAADDRILKEPAAVVAVNELADSSVNFIVRPWCKSADYFGVYFSMTEKIKQTFDQNGISIPYPQRDVYMHQVGSEAV
ncbi:MAG: mechanosensitive ion channel domain-containing protein [Arenicellales bacterium]